MEITSKSIRYNSQIFPVKNIANSRLVEKPHRGDETKAAEDQNHKVFRNYLVLFFGAVVFLTIKYFPEFGSYGTSLVEDVVTAFVTLFAISIVPAILLYTIFVRNIFFLKTDPPLDKIYGIELVTNSGSSNLFWNEDQNFVRKVGEKIFAVLEGEDDVALTVNLDNRTILDASSTTNNTTINHNYDYSIQVKQYEGIQPEAMSYFTDTLSKNLEDLGAKIESVNSPELQADMQALVSEFNEKKPNPSVISSLWNRVKQLGDGCGLANDLIATGGVVMGALSLLGSS